MENTTCSNVISTTASNIYENFSKWFPYVGAVSVVSEIAAFSLGLGNQNFVISSPFVTGALSFAAFQIGCNISSQSTHLQMALRVTSAVAATLAFAYFTSVPVITALSFAILNSLVKELLVAVTPKNNITNKLLLGTTGVAIIALFIKTIQLLKIGNSFVNPASDPDTALKIILISDAVVTFVVLMFILNRRRGRFIN